MLLTELPLTRGLFYLLVAPSRLPQAALGRVKWCMDLTPEIMVITLSGGARAVEKKFRCANAEYNWLLNFKQIQAHTGIAYSSILGSIGKQLL